MWFYASLLSKFTGRIPLESPAGIEWNPWPESNGIRGRNAVEYTHSRGLPQFRHSRSPLGGNPMPFL